MNQQAKEGLPPCFGDPKLWDPKAVECIGGQDPAFTSERGDHVRDKCIFFEGCGQRAQASKMEAARGLLDPKNLIRRDVPLLGPARPVAAPTAPPAPNFIERFATAMAHQHAQAGYPPLPTVPSMPYYGMKPTSSVQQPAVPAPPAYGYQQMMPVNYQMPGYLTVPEQRYEGQSFWSFLGRTVLRSLGKSMGHSIAHLFDTVPLAPPPREINVAFRNGE